LKKPILRDALDALGFAEWFKVVAGSTYETDPWGAFKRVYQEVKAAPAELRIVVDLFVRGEAVEKHLLQSTIGEEVTLVLQNRGVLAQDTAGLIISSHCMLSCFDLYVLIEQPAITQSGRLVSQHTYLSSGSYDCAREIMSRRSLRRSLDWGSGTGILNMMLSQRSEQSIGIEIDPMAAQLSVLNLAINGLRASILQSDGVSCLRQSPGFDFIAVNPPWRLVPPGIAYPNPHARVGIGADGLDLVRQAFRTISSLLNAGGEAIVRFDLPRGIRTAEEIMERPECLVGPQFSLHAKSLGRISTEAQSEISADTCVSLNPNVPDLRSIFVDYYKQLGVLDLDRLMCVVRK
jgi:hypothetical protein